MSGDGRAGAVRPDPQAPELPAREVHLRRCTSSLCPGNGLGALGTVGRRSDFLLRAGGAMEDVRGRAECADRAARGQDEQARRREPAGGLMRLPCGSRELVGRPRSAPGAQASPAPWRARVHTCLRLETRHSRGAPGAQGSLAGLAGHNPARGPTKADDKGEERVHEGARKDPPSCV